MTEKDREFIFWSKGGAICFVIEESTSEGVGVLDTYTIEGTVFSETSILIQFQ